MSKPIYHPQFAGRLRIYFVSNLDQTTTDILLSQLLNRSEDYLRLKVLNPMVKSGRLVRVFPAKPNDSRQA